MPTEHAHMAGLGNRVALGLADGSPGEADGRSGWRGGLQWAADLSGNDPEVLRIADDVYAAEAELSGRPDAVARYATDRMRAVGDGPARWFLLGMVGAVDAGARR